jgi:hypothetical protein
VSRIDLTNFTYNQTLPLTSVTGKFPYTFVSNDSKKLVVTIGDSWTWAADLTATDELSVRLAKSFGGIVANELSADFLNLGQCGTCNLHIIERIKELCKIIPTLEYHSIIVIITYTEVARSINGPYDKTVNYHDWFDTHPLTSIDDFNLFLAYHNGLGQEHILRLMNEYDHVTVIIGNNFTDPIGMRDSLNILSKTWIELYNEHTLQKEYSKPCYILAHWVIDKLPGFIKEFKPTVDHTDLNSWLIYLVDCANARTSLIDSRYYAGVNHPTQLGHEIWANYLLEQLQ